MPRKNSCIENVLAFVATIEVDRPVSGSTAPKTLCRLATVLEFNRRTRSASRPHVCPHIWPHIWPHVCQCALLTEPRLVLEERTDPLAGMRELQSLDKKGALGRNRFPALGSFFGWRGRGDSDS